MTPPVPTDRRQQWHLHLSVGESPGLAIALPTRGPSALLSLTALSQRVLALVASHAAATWLQHVVASAGGGSPTFQALSLSTHLPPLQEPLGPDATVVLGTSSSGPVHVVALRAPQVGSYVDLAQTSRCVLCVDAGAGAFD